MNVSVYILSKCMRMADGRRGGEGGVSGEGEKSKRRREEKEGGMEELG